MDHLRGFTSNGRGGMGREKGKGRRKGKGEGGERLPYGFWGDGCP